MRHTGLSSADASASVLDEVAQIAQARRDPRAFAPLYHRYVDAVYRYCFRRLGNAEAAADTTSLIFARALTALPHYQGTGPFRSWLFAIAHNAVIDSQHELHAWMPLAAGANRIDPSPNPEETALRADAAHELRAVLARLPRDQRQVVELRLAGLSNAEMAMVLGRSVPAIKMLQARALLRLRSLLDTPGEPHPRSMGHQR
jgi:RNA polymerase sigma-70 factor (ECF subfamily)